MILYKITAKRNTGENDVNENQAGIIRNNTEKLYRNSGKKCIAAVTELDNDDCEIAAAVKAEAAREYTPEKIADIGGMNGWRLSHVSTSELVVRDFKKALREAEMGNFIMSCKKLLYDIKINPHNGTDNECIAERLPRSEFGNLAENLLCKNTLLPEIDRIYAQKNTTGRLFHPVHYIIKSDNERDDSEIINGLISALYENGRLLSGRYVTIELYTDDYIDKDDLSKLYEAHSGGTVVVRLYPEEENDNPFRRSSPDENMQVLIDVINKYSDNTLTIAVLPCGNTKETGKLYQGVLSPLVEIYSENASGGAARQNLIHRAERIGTEPDSELTDFVKDNKTYCPSELGEHFERWYKKKTTEQLYPQYAQLTNACPARSEQGGGKALVTLDSMIGLSEAKKIIHKALDFYKVQRLYSGFGKQHETLSMHMVFTGSPGTAKTTTARLFAEILKDNGIITNGRLVEVGRADLIGKFVGHTAPLVKKAFEDAKGGVLFIDEAYSLLDRDNNLYGDEAINTIVQEMENSRNDTIVIFAGYTNEIEQFLDRNPGLRSRIAFHVPFEDYTPEELLKIAALMADNKENKIAPDANNKLLGIFRDASKAENFGNGRFVRNIMEQAEMNRASRVAKTDAAKITREMLETFTADDFEYALPKIIKNGIGFITTD